MKKLVTVIIIVMLFFMYTPFSRAEESKPLQSTFQYEGVLVVDVSLSMETSDPNRLSNEAMKMFIDMSSVSGDKIGVVAYSDEVVYKKELTKMESLQDKADLKNYIDSLGRYPYTDLSVGVKEAVNLLNNGHKDGHYPLIVLLADGNNDLDEFKGRTEEDSKTDLQQSIKVAKTKGYPIYTIGLNADGTLNNEMLISIAQETSGKFFETSSAEDLPSILNEIFADHMKLKVHSVENIEATGDFQDIEIEIPNESVLEANISILSDHPIEIMLLDPSGSEVSIPSDLVLYSTSNSYSMLKLLNPTMGVWTLKVKGVEQDQIDINLVFNYALDLTLDSIEKSYRSGDKISFHAFFTENKERVEDPQVYENMKATLLVKNLENNEIEQIPLNQDENGFTGSFEVGNASNYEIIVRAESDSFYRETKPTTFTVEKQSAVSPATAKPDESSKSALVGIPWTFLLILLAVLFVLFFFTKGRSKKKGVKSKRGFSGQMIIEVVDDETGMRSSPQFKKLSQYKRKFSVHQLLSQAPELEVTSKIIFKTSKGEDLTLLNDTDCKIEKNGVEVDASKGITVKKKELLKIKIKMINKTVLLEYLPD